MIRAEERQKLILRTAEESGFASIRECAAQLDVSVETVRRDIAELCGRHQVRKVRGGAAPVKTPMRRDQSYHMRIQQNLHEKRSVGMAAAAMVRDGAVIGLDCGVSIQAVARCLTGVRDLTLVTNSLPTASILSEKCASGEIGGRVIMIGGELDVRNHFARGAAVTDELDRYYFDLSFISCTAISADGVFSYHSDECTYSAHLLKRSAHGILIADSNKIGKRSVKSFAALSDFDTILLDDRMPISEDMTEAIRNSGTELIVVKTE